VGGTRVRVKERNGKRERNMSEGEIKKKSE
jgi:hypothetical protein